MNANHRVPDHEQSCTIFGVRPRHQAHTPSSAHPTIDPAQPVRDLFITVHEQLEQFSALVKSVVSLLSTSAVCDL